MRKEILKIECDDHLGVSRLNNSTLIDHLMVNLENRDPWTETDWPRTKRFDPVRGYLTIDGEKTNWLKTFWR